MLDDIKHEIKTDLTNKVNQQHQQQPPMRRLLNAFLTKLFHDLFI